MTYEDVTIKRLRDGQQSRGAIFWIQELPTGGGSASSNVSLLRHDFF